MPLAGRIITERENPMTMTPRLGEVRSEDGEEPGMPRLTASRQTPTAIAERPS